MSEEAIFLNSGPLLSGERLEAMEDLPEWVAVEEEARAVYERIKEAFEKHSTLLAGNPSLEETRFFMINTTLHALGYTHSVHEPVPTDTASVARVDYTLFPDAETFLEALEMRGSLSFFRASVGLGKAVAWTGALDEVPAPVQPKVHDDRHDDHHHDVHRDDEDIRREEEAAQQAAEEAAAAAEEADNAEPGILPAAELDALLRVTTVDYGLLTNGWMWRIYHRGTSERLDTFFQADLIAAIKSDFEDFKRFYLLFRKDGFVRTDSGTSFIDEMLH